MTRAAGAATRAAGEDVRDMRNGVLVIVGLFVAAAGVIFALQGFGVLGGSAMSGSSLWAVLGPLIALAGLGLAAAGLRRGRGGVPSR
jgi:hypothetical protein